MGKYDSNKWYEFYFHYMHYYPGDIVIVRLEGNLVERTIELLKKDPAVVIDNIKEIDKENAE